jgi:hypothetical protein
MPISVILWIATAVSVAAGTYCKRSNSVHFAHIWLKVLQIYSTTVAILSSIRFHKGNETKLKQHGILLKLLAFKGIIGLNGLQTVCSPLLQSKNCENNAKQFILSILYGQHAIKPTKHMSYHDVDIGLPSFILACEMPLFAILLFFAFPVSSYNSKGPTAGPMSALIDAFDIRDLLSAYVRGPMRLVREQQRQIFIQNSVGIGMSSPTRRVSDSSEQIERVKNIRYYQEV